jgi:hypothetical protein
MFTRARKAATAAGARTRRLTVGEVQIARLETWIGWTIMVCAVIAAAVSFAQIKWAASLIGIPEIMAWGMPIIVDGIGTVMAALTLSVHNRPFRQRAYVWTCFLVFIGFSLFCNTLHAVTYVAEHPIALPGELARARWVIVFLLAAIPPTGAAIGMHAFAFIRRHGVVSDLRASTADARTLTRAPARAHAQPDPAAHSGVHGAVRRQEPRARTPAPAAPAPSPHAAPAVSAAATPARGRAHNGADDKWARLLADPEAARAWDSYQRLRAEADGERPAPKDVHEQARVRKDRSTVSRWMTGHFDARWNALHDAPVHAQNGKDAQQAVPDPQDVHAQPGTHARTHAQGGAHNGVHAQPDTADSETPEPPAHTDNGKITVG